MEPPADIRLSFDQVPELYDRVRPGYPSSFFDAIFDLLPVGPAICEVAPGTGQATAGLIDRAGSVVAVEIGAGLSQTLAAKHRGDTRVQVINAPFETAPLAFGEFDAVVSACAYHWIDEAVRVARPHALLRPDGWLALIELFHVASLTDGGYFDRVQPIYESFGLGRDGWMPPTYESANPAFVEQLQASNEFGEPQVARVPWDQTYSSAQFRELVSTFSPTRMMAPADRVSFVDQLVAVVDDEFGGVVTRPLVATMTLAQAR